MRIPDGATNRQIHLAVTIDTECDKGPGWRVRQPLGFKNILEGVPDRLQRTFDKWGIRATYLLSPEVLGNADCAQLFRNLAGRAELGTHLHSEFVNCQSQETITETSSFQSDFPPEIELKNLKALTNLFVERIGYAPTSFRAGRFGISGHTIRFLEQLGYTVDSSVTPHMWWWRARGRGVNFLGAPDQPYHPNENDFRRPGSARLLEVPVTLVNRFWDKWPRPVLRQINPINRMQTIALNTLLRKQMQCSWLRPTYADADEMLAVTDYMLHHAKGDAPLVLCMMFHSNEATAGMSPYYETEAQVDEFIDRLERYLDALFARPNVSALGLSDVARPEMARTAA